MENRGLGTRDFKRENDSRMMLGSLGSEIKSPLKDESGDSNVLLDVLSRSSSRVRSGRIKTIQGQQCNMATFRYLIIIFINKSKLIK